MDDYSKLKAQLLAAKDVRGRVWPRAALKARAAEAVAAMRGRGLRCAEIAEALGVSAATVVRWDPSPKRTRHRRRKGPAQLVAVTVEPVREAPALTLELGDYRLHGLTVESAADLLQRLA